MCLPCTLRQRNWLGWLEDGFAGRRTAERCRLKRFEGVVLKERRGMNGLINADVDELVSPPCEYIISWQPILYIRP